MRILLVFVFKLVEEVIRSLFRSGGRSSSQADWQRLTPRERVLELERIRQRRNYKAGWLYYRCRELGLEDTLTDLRKEGNLPAD